MKISLVCVEDALMNVGFRKLAAYVNKKLKYDTDIYYYTLDQTHKSYYKMITGKIGQNLKDDEDQLQDVAESVGDAEIVAFSSMTPYASSTKKLIEHVRSVNPHAFVVWGGIHPIVQPEDAIEHADAICTGEGEFAFEEFLHKYEHGHDFTDTRNFWFNLDGEIIRNQHRPLMTEEEMADLPLLQYGEDEKIYKTDKGFVPLTPKIYRQHNGLTYNAIWSIGCPLHCTFCANTKFIENHSNYTQVRHPPPSYIVDEIKNAMTIHPYLSSVTFHDDSMMALHPDTLREFAEEWKKRLDIPFTVMGVIPNYVTEERIQILLDAGMHRLRMGIQSGSEEILEFYKRPAPPKRVKEAVEIFNKYQKYMIPPRYDLIVDNPVETRKNVVETIDLFDEIPRPYHLDIYSLRAIPNTKLEDQLEERNLTICDIGKSTFSDCSATMANCLLFLNATFELPEWLYEEMHKRAEPADETENFYPILLLVSRLLHYVQRGLRHIRFLEFSTVGTSFGYTLWKFGLLKPLRKLLIPRYTIEKENPESPPDEPATTNHASSVNQEAV